MTCYHWHYSLFLTMSSNYRTTKCNVQHTLFSKFSFFYSFILLSINLISITILNLRGYTILRIHNYFLTLETLKNSFIRTNFGEILFILLTIFEWGMRFCKTVNLFLFLNFINNFSNLKTILHFFFQCFVII